MTTADNIEAATRRVNTLIQRQMQSQNDDGEYPITLELCDIIRRHGTEIVLDQLKVNLKHGPLAVQLRALSILNQCVLCSGPNVAIALSTEKWSDRFFNIAKTTKSPFLRERIIRQLLVWYNKYRTNGLEQSLGRFAQSKTLKDDFLKVNREVEEEEAATRRAQPSSARTPQSPVYADPNASTGTQVQRGRASGYAQQPSSATTGTPSAGRGVVTPVNAGGIANARQQQHREASSRPGGTNNNTTTAVAVGGSSMEHYDTLSNLETFIMDAQGDLASLEYGLSHPEMLDKNTARDCKKHKLQVGRLLQMEIEIPPQYSEALYRLLENLSNALEVYEMFSGEDLGEGGLGRFQSFGAPAYAAMFGAKQATRKHSKSSIAATAASPVAEQSSGATAPAAEESSGDEREEEGITGLDTTAAEQQAVEAQQNAMKIIDQERAELAQARAELNALRTQNEDLQNKYKDAKVKNKKALTMLTESGAQIEELENRIVELTANTVGGGGGSAKATSPPRVVEKVVVQRPTVNPVVLETLRHSLSSIRRSLREIRSEYITDWQRDFKFMSSQVQASIANIVVASQKDRQNDAKALQWAQDLYKKEMKLRKQYYNQIQELKGNIRVYCRVRPMSDKETADGHTCVCEFPSTDELRLLDGNGRVRMFEFDNVYAPDTTQIKVFEDTSPLIDSVVDGFNVCIFAYGQTGSGKTYTMNGYGPETKGINKRALDRLFHIIDERKESEESTVHVSVLEIYCEQIRDLLVSRAEASRQTYDVKTGGPYGNYVTNLSDIQVNSPLEIDTVMDRAASNRSEGRTDMNAHSSRSHMILYVLVRTRNVHTGVQSYGKLSLVDLAGSERLDKSGSEGQAAKEAVAINKSLSALGDVIAGLSNTQKHIPFRNSILTFLLQDSMAGQAKVLMFACISPASYNVSESSSSLQFAVRARGVSLGQAKKNVIAN